MPATQPSCGNLLLGRLSGEDYGLLEPHLDRVSFELGAFLGQAGEAIHSLCFPEGGVASLHDVLGNGDRVGIGLIGREGFVGWQVLLGGGNAQHESVVGVPSHTALSIERGCLLDACAQSDSLRLLLLRYVQTLFTQMGRTIVSNLNDAAEVRLARWLLMNHDRVEDDRIPITHQQIGVMLGVRRATVTDALHILEGESLIRCSRGQISIRDRKGLKRVAGENYGAPEAEYQHLIAPFGKDED